MHTQHQELPPSSYVELQKQLDEEHKRLLQEREIILSTQCQKLQLYEKIDLVEFFNYQPFESESSKTQIMYHLSQKFKKFMKNFTQNNVYKRMGHLVNPNTQRQRSESKSKGKTNVQKNSDLGRMFQTQKLYQNSNQINPISSPRYSERQHKYQGPSFYDESQMNPTNFDIDKQGLKLKNEENANKFQSSFSPKLNPNNQNSQMLFSAKQLSHALDQQQKIYLLTQLNHYIKAYKESQTKKSFMSKHLENLHEYLVDVRLNYESKNKNKSKIQTDFKSYSVLLQENQLLKKQIQTYRQQIQAFNGIENQKYYEKLYDNRNSSPRKCIQVKKVDRFKQFAEHIQVMQGQLTQLMKSIQTQSKPSVQKQSHSYIKQLKAKVKSLEEFIQKEGDKKEMFLHEVKKFKEMMKQKDQQIYSLRQNIIYHQQKSDKSLLKNPQAILGIKNFDDFNNVQTERSISKTKYLSPRKSLNQFKENEISCKKDQFDRFIDSALANNDKKLQNSFIYSRLTTKQPSQTGGKHQQHSISSNKRISLPHENPNSIKFDSKSNTGSRLTYHSKMQPFENSTSRQRASSRSRSRYQSKQTSKSRSRTNFISDYEPRPYERYNKLLDYSEAENHRKQLLTDLNPLYSRISQNQKDNHKCQYELNF